MSEKERSTDHEYLTIPADQVVEDDILVNWGYSRVCSVTAYGRRRVSLNLDGGISILFASELEVIVKRPKPKFVTIPAGSVRVGDEVFGEGVVVDVVYTVSLKFKADNGFITLGHQTSDPLSVRRK